MITHSQLSFPPGILLPLAAFPATMHDWLAFLGRTHVVVIHFPIALLLMAALGEIVTRLRRRPAGWTTATLLCGALGAAASTTLGWMLLIFNGYDHSPTLTLHQYFGTSTAILSLITAAAHFKFARPNPTWLTTSLILLTAALVALTSHLGGTLVHGNLLSLNRRLTAAMPNLV